jgi:quinol monooxygenase YgiN
VEVNRFRFPKIQVGSGCLALIICSWLATVPVIGQESTTSSSEKIPGVNMVATNAEDSAQNNMPVAIVTHVDAMPPFTEKAVKLLREYRQNALKENGNRRIDILQQVGRPNHFSIVEEWENQKSFKEHESAPHTRQFRSDMQDALGAPFDERPHKFISP